ncbi:TonB-dependent receptor [uncultured Erythrobacter sp.]|uniref:TonB-dependent receptor n=1 Tax=uncultured Erythrobacter sp. TaxID=263913 RepID=UPI0026082896|nr:TonB-dependent receptor [uncultured Erythrobacter sp.]
MLATPAVAVAQSNDGETQDVSSENDTAVNNEIIVSGIRQSLASALDEKRTTDNIIEVIQAEDIGKLPDQNLAEVLENITGVQITRDAGVGTGVQIRGTGANRVEINGVSTVGSGTGRSGISFEDLPAALIAAVEVIKVPEAKTIEGSVGGTVNLRTLRPLDITEPLLALRAQGEHSNLLDTVTPRLSATIGNSWDTGAGEIGLVMSASYAELDVSEFFARVDRDRTVLPGASASSEAFPFLRVQFLDQDINNQEYTTINWTGSLEWKPSDNLRFYVDATINDQERVEQGSRAFFSGTTSSAVINNTNNTSFETVDFGTVQGPNGALVLGEVQAVTSGILGVGVTANGTIDPNLRTSTTTGARQTDSTVMASGLEWNEGRFTVLTEVSRSTSDSTFPGLGFQFDFINPNGPQPSLGQSSDNGVPAVFDVSGGILQFGIAPGLAETPTTEQLLDPANYRIRQVSRTANTNDNSETAVRLDLSFESDGVLPFFSSIDAGWRYSVSEAENIDSSLRNNFTATSSPSFFRPTFDQLGGLVIPGESGFDAAGGGRTLFIPDYLQIDPAAAANDPDGVLAAINDAIEAQNAANGVSLPLISQPTETLSSFFDIQEKTLAAYFQGNYDTELAGMPIRGNVGVRWVSTNIDSIGNNVVNGAVEGQIRQSSNYEFWLPRASLVLEPATDLLIRAGVSRDLRRPNFDNLSTSVGFGGSATAAVNVGNPQLEPETVWSFDLSGEYYFSDTGFFSVGFFHKRRTNLFAQQTEFPVEVNGPNGIERDITDPCEGGGIFNPFADRNVFSPIQGIGICVPVASTFNSDGVATQTGVEVAFQYDLSDFEDTLGFASGFGFIGNFTYQEDGGDVSNFFNGSGGGNALNLLLGRTDSTMATQTLDDDVVQQLVTLPNLSRYAYNATLFYDKYGLNFRARYSWRSSFRGTDTRRFGLPRIIDDRGQLNASLSYALTDQFTVGVDGINLLRERSDEFCIREGALLCQQDTADRRIVGGISFKF